MYPVRRQISPHAARLRRDQTEVEQRFWLAVRNRRLGSFKIGRQATIGPYLADFLCIETMLIVELDGRQHDPRATRREQGSSGSTHRVIRFWNNDVVENLDGVLETVAMALVKASGNRRRRPSPSPLP